MLQVMKIVQKTLWHPPQAGLATEGHCWKSWLLAESFIKIKLSLIPQSTDCGIIVNKFWMNFLKKKVTFSCMW